MKPDPYYQFWSALQRVSQQAIWDSVTDTVERDHETLRQTAIDIAHANPAGGTLTLNPTLTMPTYVTAADIHLMPGGYVGADPSEMRQGPLYDRGLYLYIGGNCGPENDGLTHMLNAALKARFPKIVGPKTDDICYATQNRQDAIKTLAQQCDVVIVVGSPNSSNSTRLREVAANQGVTAYMVDNARELEPAWVAGKARIGVTAGASTPDVLVQAVVTRLKELGASKVSELFGITERVTFPMPKNLSAEVS